MSDESKEFKVLRKGLVNSQKAFEAVRDDELKKINIKVTYKDLSNPLKVAVILAYIVGSIYVLSFMIGFVIGMSGI